MVLLLYMSEARHIIFVHGKRKFLFEGLVVENLDVDILASTPFMEHNDISTRPARSK